MTMMMISLKELPQQIDFDDAMIVMVLFLYDGDNLVKTSLENIKCSH